MPTGDEVLSGLLSTAYQLDDKAVAELKESDGSFKADALDILKKKDADRVTAFKTEREAFGQQRYGEAKSEVLGREEAALRKEYEITDDKLKLKDLVAKIVTDKLAKVGTMDEAKAKASTPYLQLQEELAKEREGNAAKVKAAVDEVMARIQGEQDQLVVREQARLHLQEWKPVYGTDDQAQRTRLENDFLDLLRTHPCKVVRDADGAVTDILPLKADGSRLKDAHGHPVSLKSLVEEKVALRYVQHKTEQREGAPDPNKVGGGSAGGSVKYPATMTLDQYATEMERLLKLPKAERAPLVDELKKHGKAVGLV